MTPSQGIVICGEVLDGKLTTVTRELLALGKKLRNDLDQPLAAVLVGRDIQKAAEEAVRLGAATVYVADGPPFSETHPDLYVAILAEAIKRMRPLVIVLGHTEMGREVAPRLATRLGTAVTMDCTALSIDPETRRLLQFKPVYGGNAVAVCVSESCDPQIVTLRPRSVMAEDPDALKTGEVKTLNVTVSDSMIKGRLLETVKQDAEGIKLEDAKVIVAGGGGIGGSEGFKMLEELAGVLRGAVGVTRVPCDEGWKPLSLEIGQTGHIVTPDLYIAVGVSGAPQHMAGCLGSKCIVAINRDPDAQIFKEADFGVVGDYRQVLPTLIAKCKALLA
jgi:electron transfer flavoprotein alpha subunit